MEARYDLIPLSPADLAHELNSNPTQHTHDIVLIDVRPNGQYCSSHISQAENLNFSNILLRRLLKGVITLDAVISSLELAERVCGGARGCADKKLIFYDTLSTAANVRNELARHVEAIYTNRAAEKFVEQQARVAYFVDGGFAAFAAQFPDLCEQSTARPGRSPILSVSVSSSLPISLNCSSAQPKSTRRMQTPSCESESSRFGPPVELLPHLVLGCEKDSANLSGLRQMGVTAVLNVSHNCPNHFESLFEYMGIHVEDSYQADLLSKLHTAFAFIDQIKAKGGKVFVHCRAGVSRSATVCIAYIMKQMGYDLTNAYDFVKNKRPCISPNLHFMGQLLEFQKQLCSNGESASLLVLADDASCANNTVAHEQQIQQHSAACRVPCSTTCDNEIIKPHSVSAPSSLHLFSKSRSKSPDGAKCRKSNESTVTTAQLSSRTLPLTSLSLPSTPVTMFKNHFPGCHEAISPYTQQPLQLSTCRVIAHSTECCMPYLSLTETL